MRSKLLAVFLLLAATRADAHPGVGGCKATALLGDLQWAADCSATLNSTVIKDDETNITFSGTGGLIQFGQNQQLEFRANTFQNNQTAMCLRENTGATGGGNDHYCFQSEFDAPGGGVNLLFNIDPALCTGGLNGGKLTVKAGNSIECSDDIGGGGGGITNVVGDCTTASCFTGADGHTLQFEVDGDKLLSGSAASVDGGANNKLTFKTNVASTIGANQTIFELADSVTVTHAVIDTPAGAGSISIGHDGQLLNRLRGDTLELVDDTLGGNIRFRQPGDPATTSYVAIAAPTAALTAGTYTLTLPLDDGTPNQVLATNGSGVLSWATGGGGISTVGDCSTNPCFTGPNGTWLTSDSDFIIGLDDNGGATNSFLVKANGEAGANVLEVTETAKMTLTAPAGQLPELTFVDPAAAAPPTTGTIRLPSTASIKWDVATDATDQLIQLNGKAIRLGASTAAGFNIEILGTLLTGAVQVEDQTPFINFRDTDSGNTKTTTRYWSECTSVNDCSWQLTNNSGDADGTRVSMLSVLTTDPGLSTVYLGSGTSEGTTTPPTNAVTVEEKGASIGPTMTSTGTAEIRNAYPRCVYLRADEIDCWDTNAGTSTYGCTPESIVGAPGATYMEVLTNNFAPNPQDEFASAHFSVPPGWNTPIPPAATAPTLKVTIDWISNNAACSGGTTPTSDRDTVCWMIDTGSVVPNSGNFLQPTLNGTAKGNVTTCSGTNSNVSAVLQSTDITGYIHSMVGGERGILKIWRDQDATGAEGLGCISPDEYLQQAKLVGVRMCRE